MILRASIFLLLPIFLFSVAAEARIFSFNTESFAAYLKGGIAPTPFDNTLNSGSYGANSTMDSDLAYNASGEFGFVYATPRAQMRFGLEILRPPDKKDERGSDTSGAALYTMTSEMTILIPKFGLDITLKQWQQSRAYIGGTVGYANLAARNSYTFTTAGTSQYSLGDFYEELRGTTLQYEALAGFERILSDSTTFAFEAGYRSLSFPEITYGNDTTNFQGAANKGEKALNRDGANRTLELTQFNIGLNLRFWIH